MKRFGCVCHFLLVLTSLTYLFVMIDGYPLSRSHPVYIPAYDDYYITDFNDSNVSAASKFVLQNFGERYSEDSAANEKKRSSASNIKLKKKNSEIIGALMGLRKALSNSYISN